MDDDLKTLRVRYHRDTRVLVVLTHESNRSPLQRDHQEHDEEILGLFKSCPTIVVNDLQFVLSSTDDISNRMVLLRPSFSVDLLYNNPVKKKI